MKTRREIKAGCEARGLRCNSSRYLKMKQPLIVIEFIYIMEENVYHILFLQHHYGQYDRGDQSATFYISASDFRPMPAAGLAA